MPELPEVETVRKGLLQLIKGKKVSSIDVFWNRIIEAPSVDEFRHALVNQQLEDVHRRGKFLIFKWSDYDMISHLRMEGKYEFFPKETEEIIGKHTHVVFHFSDGSTLHYNDVRKFGRIDLVGKNQANIYKGIQQLGPEPTPDVFKLEPFRQQLSKSNKSIKPLLLDQKIVTGLGNIYVDEALWQAKIHPETSAKLLDEAETENLYQAIIEVLARAVAAGGTTIRSYANALGEAGKFQISLHAYGQTELPCEHCGRAIVKTKVAQRGTHFCPNCQIRKEE